MEFSSRIRFFVILYGIVFVCLAFIIYTNSFETPALELDDTFLSLSGFSNINIKHLTIYYKILIACIISLLPSLYFVNSGVKRATALAATSGAFIIIATYFLLSTQQILIPIFYFEFSLLSGTAAAIILKMVISSSQANFLQLAFSQFVSESMLKELMKNPDKLTLQGAEIDITVFFLDIRGFTTFSERNTPILVVHHLNDLLDKVTNIILDHGGTVDKFMGDAVMAFWGAPKEDKKQATHAVEAAIAVKNTIQTETQFSVGVGLNYGHAIVGNMGSTRRFDYTAIGDTVNTAKRLESATKELGETIVMSASVVEKLKEEKAEIETKNMGHVTVKGKTQPVHVFGLDPLQSKSTSQ